MAEVVDRGRQRGEQAGGKEGRQKGLGMKGVVGVNSGGSLLDGVCRSIDGKGGEEMAFISLALCALYHVPSCTGCTGQIRTWSK